MSFLRGRLARERVRPADELRSARDGERVCVAGVVLVRQRPGSAKGVVFMTLEDETGIANAIVWPKVLERNRRIVMAARLIVVHGRVQRHENIIHLIAERLEDRSHWLALLADDGAEDPRENQHNNQHVERFMRGENEFRQSLARADEVARPGPDPQHLADRAGSSPRQHPRKERVVPRSRDFH